MDTSVKAGWARQQYARDRFDVAISMSDLPLILIEQGADPALLDTIPFSVRWEIIRTQAEIFSKLEYLRHEAADAGWKKGDQPTTAMEGARRDHDAARARMTKLVEPYLVKDTEPAAP